MLFQEIAIVGGAAADPDPRSSPGTVPVGNLIELQGRLPNGGGIPSSMALALEGTAGERVVVEVWALRETSNRSSQLDDLPAPAARKYYLLEPAFDVPVGEVVRVRAVLGKIYLRATVKPAHSATLLIGESSSLGWVAPS